ncbi:MAG TPA: heavy metal-binding domain-containing protein [Solirubrobacteraceae bacterium]|nr:heavy metal-binding domain-containing protein [Solirubrobacteraceae bacterium]
MSAGEREPAAGAGEPAETPAQEAEERTELEHIEAGGIPMAAERRLGALRQGGGAFTSDLSVSGFALCHRLGLKPLSQVMGSSIYQMGYQGASWPMMMGGAVLTELVVLSEAWNEVRRLALNRLALEAEQAGADAVVGVQVRTAAHDWAEGAIEYAVLGTAVSRAGHGQGGGPVLTELSVSEYAKLIEAGVEPLGIVAWTSVFFAAQEQALGLLGGGGYNPMSNYELPQLTQGVYGAREQVMRRIGQQAQSHGASGIVGVRVGHSVRRQEVGGGIGGTSRAGAVITFDAIGTAVRDTGAAKVSPPQTKLDLNE